MASNGGRAAPAAPDAGGSIAVRPHDDSNTHESGSSSSSGEVIFRAQVWLDNAANMTRVLDCLDNPLIQFVDMYLQEAFLAAVPLEKLVELMTKIGRLPQLERLDISCPLHHNDTATNHSASLPVVALVAAFQHAHRLTHLLLVNLQLTGSRNEFAEWARTTQSCLPRLHLIVMAELELALAPAQADNGSDDDDVWETSLLDPLVEALAVMPALGHVLITGREPLGELLPSSLAKLVTSHSLRDLSMSQFDLKDQHLVAMLPAMSSNASLQELDLEFGPGCMGVEGAVALAKMLQDNQCLEELTLRMMQQEQQEERTTIVGREGATIVSRRRANTTTTTSQKEDDDDAKERLLRQERNVIVANGVGKSRLSKFDWHADDDSLLSTDGQEPFVELLKDNVYLEVATLITLSGDQPLKTTADFYLNLNKLGRGLVLQPAMMTLPPPPLPIVQAVPVFPEQRPHRACMRKPSKRRAASRANQYCWPTNAGDSSSISTCTKNCKSNDLQWIDMLSKVSDDVPGLFYFLSINPSLCALASASALSNHESDKHRPKGEKKRRKGGENSPPPTKRTRLYRAAKYQRISYK